MRKCIRLFLLLIVIALLFFYKDQITGHWVRYTGSDTPVWIGDVYSRSRAARELGEFETSFMLLQELEQKLRGESGASEEGDAEKHRAAIRQVICEQAAVYKEMAMRYLEEGNEQQYMDNMRLSNEKLTLCLNRELARDA